MGDLTEEYLTPMGWLAPKGYLYFIWVLPYGALVMLLAGLYAPFLDTLPKSHQMGPDTQRCGLSGRCDGNRDDQCLSLRD
jgi:hypothetical protein